MAPPPVPSTPAPAKVPPGESPGASTRRWAWAIAAASVVFLLLESADAFIAVPLREISSCLAQILLSAFGLPVTRQGTILSTPGLTFDVVPACSGSTTLRVLLFVCIAWCGAHPKLTAPRRAVAIGLSVPFALAANALRVSVLVAAGHAAGAVPGDLFHVGTGCVAFVAAMAATFAMTERLAAAAPSRRSGGLSAGILLFVLLLFLYAPLFAWCAASWTRSPLDRFGYGFVAASAAVAGWMWRRLPADYSRERWGTIGFVASLLLHLVALVVDVNLLRAFAFLLTCLSLALAYKGPRYTLSVLPWIGIAYLGMPTVSYQIQAAIFALAGMAGMAAIAAVKCLLALSLVSAFACLRRCLPTVATAPAASGRRSDAALVLSVAAVAAAFQGYFYAVASGPSGPSELDMSYLQGEWTGQNVEIPADVEAFFGRGRYWSRRYRRGGDHVDVQVTTTGGNRHRAHPPAYCLTGGGWILAASRTDVVRVGGGRTIPVTRMRLTKEGREIAFCYWFTDGSEMYADYGGMLVQDTWRRLRGRRTDWFLFRVMTESGEGVVDAFLADFQARVAPRRAQ